MAPHDLRRFVRVYDHDLDPALCQRMIESFETLGDHHEGNGRGFRAGLEDSAWTELNVTRVSNAHFRAQFRAKLDQALARYNQDLHQPIALPNSPKTADLILKRYRRGGGEGFQLHFDSIYDVANRYLVFLWYLNDVNDGGATYFPELDLRIEARRGRLLMFPPYWTFQHAGEAPRSEDKFILSTYLLF